jgi:CheY-like chemotaxis protein
MQDRGTVTIETANATIGLPDKPEEPAAGDYVMIAVTDTGAGMTKEVLARAFEPFFTTKETGKGSGLGLSQVLGFAKQSGGGMRIETRLGEGTSVKIYLPRALDYATSQALGRSAAHSGIRRKAATIMVVDDDSTVRDVTASILEDDLGHVVLRAGSGGAALDLLNRHANVDLILLDLAMPGMSGLEVARQAQVKYPAIPILFVTGYVDKSALGDVGDDRIVKKPFVGGELAEKVSAALIQRSRRPDEKVVRLRP